MAKRKPTVAKSAPKNQIERTIFFYDLHFLRADGSPHPDWQGIFRYANALIGRSRCQQRTGKAICLRKGAFMPVDRLIQGELIALRQEAVGRLMDIERDIERDIDMGDEEEASETTHFALYYGPNLTVPRLALEYNHYGPRLGDFISLLKHYAQRAGTYTELDDIRAELVILPGNHQRILDHLGRVSSIRLKIHNNNLDRIGAYAPELVAGFRQLNAFGNSEYIEVYQKFEYKSKTAGMQKAVAVLKKIVRDFHQDGTRMTDFDTIEARAEDGGTIGQPMQSFNLLDAELKKIVSVPTLPRYRRVIDGTQMLAHVVLAVKEFAPDAPLS